MIHREVIANDGTTIQTRNEGTIGDVGNEFPISGSATYRLFLPTDIEPTGRPVADQPPVTNTQTWDCPADGLDQFYPRGTATQVSLTCKFTGKISGQEVEPELETVSVSDLGETHDTTPAGAFDVRKIMVRYSTAEGTVTNEATYDFAPALGITVVQETKVSTPHGQTVTRSEVTDLTPPR